MKNILLAIIGLFLSARTLSAAVPQTGKGSGTAISHGISRLDPPNLAPFGADLKITPVYAVPAISPGFPGMLDNLFGDIEAGRPLETLPMGVLPDSPSGYSVIEGHQVYGAAAFASADGGVPMFAGVLNPQPPFNNERGYTVGWIIEISSADGTDSVSISMARYSFTSSDFLNSLGYNGQLWEKAYSLYARGYKANGDVLIVGGGDTLVKKVVLFGWSALYNGGGSQTGLNEIFNYVNGFDNFSLKLDVTLSNGQTSTRMVETHPQPGKLAISREGNRVTVKVIQGSGFLQVSEDLVNWTTLSTGEFDASKGSVYEVEDPQSKKFFRLL